MSGAASDPDRLLDEAIDLTIRLQSDPANPVALDMIRAWRARSAEHERIWARVSEMHGMTGKILTDRQNAERRRKLGLTRRNLMIAAGLGLTAAAAGAYGPDAVVWARADHMTSKGEIRRVKFADGSTAILGPDTAVAFDDHPDRRRVELLKGMSFFEVAKDARRPFVVDTGRLTATAIGTAFDVSDDAGIISVSVESGVVETRVAGANNSAVGRLSASQWMAFDPSTRGIDRGQREAGQVAAWRVARIVADREMVSALVARIARWHPGRIVIADPFVGAQKVSGLFDLSNPQRALEAVVHPAGAHVRRISQFLTVISPF